MLAWAYLRAKCAHKQALQYLFSALLWAPNFEEEAIDLLPLSQPCKGLHRRCRANRAARAANSSTANTPVNSRANFAEACETDAEVHLKIN